MDNEIVTNSILGNGIRGTVRQLPQHCCRHHCLCGSNPEPKESCCCRSPEDKVYPPLLLDYGPIR